MTFQITEKAIYKTIVWTIESENDTYFVRCTENVTHDDWMVESENEGTLDEDEEISQKLIGMCEFDNTIDE